MNTFIGRKEELVSLNDLTSKRTSSLVCILGRRRIGKSSLVEEFGKKFPSFIHIQGLSPTNKTTNEDQLKHFSESLSLQLNQRIKYFTTWTEAFQGLAASTKTGRYLILLDEISWMGGKDHLFSAQLKDVWDTHLKKNHKLILVLCGSVSSWIEENILKNTSFEGRISLEINLEELDLNEISEFWKQNKVQMSSLEKMLLLSITGGVPKYIEELVSNKSIETQIARLAFKKTGFLFNEYSRIFTEVFGRRTATYEKIIRNCVESKLSVTELAEKLKMDANSELSEHIHHLQLSGFLSRDYFYNPNGEQSKLSHLRVKDNYLRFYLKCIEPIKDRITNKTIEILSLFEIKNFESILGYQFENLILSNRPLVHKALDLSPTSIISSAPYVQRKTTKTKGGCQIDILIHSQLNVFYVCELKCAKIIDKAVIDEVKRKIAVFKLPKRSVAKPVLIFEGELYPPHLAQLNDYFYRIIHFEKLVQNV